MGVLFIFLILTRNTFSSIFDSNGSNEMDLYEDGSWTFSFRFRQHNYFSQLPCAWKVLIMNIALNSIVTNLTALLCSHLTIFPVSRSNPGEFCLFWLLILVFFISDLVVLRIVLVCSSTSMSLLFIVVSSGIICGRKVCAKAKTCSEEAPRDVQFFLLLESKLSVFYPSCCFP